MTQTPYITSVSLTGAASQQWTDPNTSVAAAPVNPEPLGPNAQVVGQRIVPKPFQEIRFKAPAANAGVASIGVMVGAAISWWPLEPGTERGWSKADLLNVPIELTQIYFKGTNGDHVVISGLPDRGHR